MVTLQSASPGISILYTRDGLITKDIMPDFLHPNEKGYRIWAEAIEPTVKRLMGE